MAMVLPAIAGLATGLGTIAGTVATGIGGLASGLATGIGGLAAAAAPAVSTLASTVLPAVAGTVASNLIRPSSSSPQINVQSTPTKSAAAITPAAQTPTGVTATPQPNLNASIVTRTSNPNTSNVVAGFGGGQTGVKLPPVGVRGSALTGGSRSTILGGGA